MEILKHVCKGDINEKIAEKLFISIRTVEGHILNLTQNLDCIALNPWQSMPFRKGWCEARHWALALVNDFGKYGQNL